MCQPFPNAKRLAIGLPAFGLRLRLARSGWQAGVPACREASLRACLGLYLHPPTPLSGGTNGLLREKSLILIYSLINNIRERERERENI
jgi:hypothetical protein